MKKIITLLLVLTLLSSVVLAQSKGIHEPGTGIEQPELKEAGQGTGQGLEDGESVRAQELQQIREQNREKLQTGLQNALGRVKNENARQRLQQNIERFQERYQARLQRMEDLEVEEVDEETGAVRVKAKEQVKFFGFIKGRATKRFEMDNKGNINERAPWYRFLYSEVEEE
ncbi:hypothetical protein GOV06_01675 [Candidatus Woesearchaeota archaeon]|nr:hypothetical protein [Candidatus Woesearchaeota archaeon]